MVVGKGDQVRKIVSKIRMIEKRIGDVDVKKKNNFIRFIKMCLIISGIMFWVVTLSLFFPSNMMGFVALFGIYWVMFGLPLTLMVVLIWLGIATIAHLKSKKVKGE